MVRLVSYASIIAIGLWMLWSALKGARGAFVSSGSDRHQHHEHHDGCGCAHLAKPAKGIGGMLSLAVGAIPCTGALLVLLFGFANDLLWSSVVLVVCISLGMALALSAVGILAIAGRRFVQDKVGESMVSQHRFAATSRVLAAMAVTVIGALLFSLAW